VGVVLFVFEIYLGLEKVVSLMRYQVVRILVWFDCMSIFCCRKLQNGREVWAPFSHQTCTGKRQVYIVIVVQNSINFSNSL